MHPIHFAIPPIKPENSSGNSGWRAFSGVSSADSQTPKSGVTIFRRRIKFSPVLILSLAFFAGLLLLGFHVYKDYGIGWDEPAQLKIALTNYSYIFNHDPALLSFKNRYYGAIYELILLKLTNNPDIRQMYLGRHLFNFLFYFSGVSVFFWLARRLFSNAWLALLASLCLVLSPRIFADSIYNTKDIPFMVAAIFAIATLVIFLDRPGVWSAFVHAGFSAFLIAIRVPGIFIPFLTLAFLAASWVFLRRPGPVIKREMGLAAVYLALTAGLIVLFWPILWHDPLGEFVNALQNMSKFPWDNPVFYQGIPYQSADLPWHYIPVWIAISTPLLYLAGFGVGSAAMLAHLFRGMGNWFEGEKRDNLILLACFFGPLLAVLAVHPVLYDAWRQMFFIYPPLLLIAISGMRTGAGWLRRLLPAQFSYAAAAIILSVGLLEPAVFMIRYHPNENIYFNRLAGENMTQITHLYETDYWGLAYKQGIDFILSTDPGENIPVMMAEIPGEDYVNDLLPPSLKDRLVLIGQEKNARYLVADYRFHPGDYPYQKEIYSVKVGGASILSVFDLRGEPGNQSK
jgi:hypothetical protein